MIYKKPQDALHMLDLVVEGGGVMSWVREVRLFLSTLPAEFEIVEPGNVQVRWPEGATKEHITWHADNQRGRGLIADSLYALAAIAPVEKKKRKVYLWEKDYPHYTERSWTSDDISRPGEGWRKVGECEVTE